MYLKRMELFGFKSFAEKTEMVFDSGIAAVIGPNGCGKSNLVDAVRWALGEQSIKSLRGTRMEEVIFSGSENRKALNFAEVSLNFAGAEDFLNLDYDEITITRRLFRSGESEYYINKSPCRLKDITELFLDTGLGKDVYSVIGQGRVDEIINSRPEERREIFEEAAGIFKYKLRKREAGRRLEETRENLVRVQDLIFELENQIEPLQSQAEVTRQYRSLRRRIEDEEKKLLSYHLKHSREQLEKTNRQLQAVGDALLAAAAEGGLYEKEVQDLRGTLQEKEAQKKDLEQALHRNSSTGEQQEGELRLLRERENRYRELIDQNRLGLARLDQQIKEAEALKIKLEEDLKERTENLDRLEKELSDQQEALAGLEKSALAAAVERQQEEIYRLSARKEAADSTQQELKRRLERLGDQKAALKSDQEALLEQSFRLEKAAGDVEDKLRELGEKQKKAAALVHKETDQEAEAQKLLEKANREEQQKREKLQGTSSRLSLLIEQDSALSGYYRGVREIMKARSSLPGVIGPVADLITVEDQYIQAIETALGSAMQYLVAAEEKAVHEAIRFLKESNRGWATFLPLDILHQGADPLGRYPGWRDLEGVIGRASELVRADASHRKAIDYLLTATVVCSTLEAASRAARFVRHSCRVVTLQGEMINPGGIIRGGSLPKRSAGMPLGRRREIEALQDEQAKAKNDLDKIAVLVVEYQKRLADCRARVEKAAAEQRNLEEQAGLLNREAESLRHRHEALQERLEAGERSAQEIEAEEKDLQLRLEGLQEEMEKHVIAIGQLESELAGTKENYRLYLEHKKTLEEKITALLVALSSYREQRDVLLERIKETADKIDLANTGKEENMLELEKSETGLAANGEEQQRLRGILETLNEKRASLLADLEKSNRLISSVEAELIEREEEGRRRQSRTTRQEKRERQLSVEQTRLQTEVNYQEMRFRELFKNLELALLDPDFVPEECSRTVDYLKEDLEALGEVNLGAIEELARLEERINFLKNQKDDLQEGEVSLRKVLAEIDQRMEYYFKSAFEKINENFQNTFRELFEGGQVMLRLTDSENMLEAGIDIVAQPPGKKLQNINLLSAGEKVLTAIALVFAILRFKPAPFYLLDEVESTLDDANLTRFTRFLRQMSAQAQFILITHRKRTMEEAALLYGVTMPEPGISRLMSLKLDNDQIVREITTAK